MSWTLAESTTLPIVMSPTLTFPAAAPVALEALVAELLAPHENEFSSIQPTWPGVVTSPTIGSVLHEDGHRSLLIEQVKSKGRSAVTTEVVRRLHDGVTATGGAEAACTPNNGKLGGLAGAGRQPGAHDHSVPQLEAVLLESRYSSPGFRRAEHDCAGVERADLVTVGVKERRLADYLVARLVPTRATVLVEAAEVSGGQTEQHRGAGGRYGRCERQGRGARRSCTDNPATSEASGYCSDTGKNVAPRPDVGMRLGLHGAFLSTCPRRWA